MKLPTDFKTLKEISTWIKKYKPNQIIITENCEIRRIREFNPYWPKERCETYQEIEIIIN